MQELYKSFLWSLFIGVPISLVAAVWIALTALSTMDIPWAAALFSPFFLTIVAFPPDMAGPAFAFGMAAQLLPWVGIVYAVRALLRRLKR